MDDQRPGAAYGIDHYVVPVSDTDQWLAFYTNVLGAVARTPGGGNAPERPNNGRRGAQFTFVGAAHVGGASQDSLPTSQALGVGVPRYRYFVRPEDIDEHLRRLDQHQVAHTAAIHTSEQGEEGVAVRFEDTDHNQLEFWAPNRLPAGAMDEETPAKVGRLAGAVYESRDLTRTADFFSQYCGMDPVLNADVEKDTLVLRFAAGGNLTFKKVDTLSKLTGGHIHPLHTALIIRGDEMMDVYQRMWNELPEWDHDPVIRALIPDDEAEALPARTGIHGSPIGAPWRAGFRRGDSFWDWDTNTFHWMPGAPDPRSPTQLTAESAQIYLDAHLATRQRR